MITSTQQALILPNRRGNLVLDTLPIPSPGQGEIRIRILASGLNPVDWKIQKTGIFVDHFPAILGTDIAGKIDAIGEGVGEFAVDERVFTQGLREPVTYAGFQQYAIARASTVAKIPPNLSIDAACTIPVALTAAYVGLYNHDPHGLGLDRPLTPEARGKYAGRPIAVLGGASRRAVRWVTLAALSGFSPIYTTASGKHAERLQKLGATVVLERTLSAEALKREIVRRNKGALLDIVYDAISSSETQQTGMALLAPGGRIAVVQPPTIAPTRGVRVIPVIGGLGQPHNVELLSEFYHGHACAFFENEWLKPNWVEVLGGGLVAVPEGLRRLERGDRVSGIKLIVRPQETIPSTTGIAARQL